MILQALVRHFLEYRSCRLGSVMPISTAVPLIPSGVKSSDVVVSS